MAGAMLSEYASLGCPTTNQVAATAAKAIEQLLREQHDAWTRSAAPER